MVAPLVVIGLAAASAVGGALFGGGINTSGKKSLVDVSQDKKQYQLKKDTQIVNTDSRSYQTTNTYTDARSLILTMNSPNASTVAKKEVSSSILPTLEPSVNTTPTIGGQNQEGGLDFSGGLSNILVLTGVGFLGYAGVKSFVKKKKRKK